MTPKFEESKEDVLYAFSIEQLKDNSTLDEYIAKYPKYSDELVDLSIDLFLSPSPEEALEGIKTSPNAELVWEKFQTMLTQPAEKLATEELTDPLVDLNKQQFKSLAKKLNLSRLLLTRLRDRTIVCSSIPQKFIKTLSNAVGVSVEHISASLVGSPRISVAENFKADGKPSASSQMSFDEAIEASNLSEEQKLRLKNYED